MLEKSAVIPKKVICEECEEVMCQPKKQLNLFRCFKCNKEVDCYKMVECTSIGKGEIKVPAKEMTKSKDVPLGYIVLYFIAPRSRNPDVFILNNALHEDYDSAEKAAKELPKPEYEYEIHPLQREEDLLSTQTFRREVL